MIIWINPLAYKMSNNNKNKKKKSITISKESKVSHFVSPKIFSLQWN